MTPTRTTVTGSSRRQAWVAGEVHADVVARSRTKARSLLTALALHVVARRTSAFAPRPRVPVAALRSSAALGERGDDDNDDEEIPVRPYGNRSLVWTLRYRELNPYEECRRRVLRFGHRSKEDWDDAASSGQLGQYVPNRPDEMYAPEWTDWDEFLGVMRDYESTRNLAVRVLGLKTFDEYVLFVRRDPRRAEGLRIPLRPDIYYKDDWVSEEDFFRRDGDDRDE